MPAYLINLTVSQAMKLEAMLGGRVEIVPSPGPLAEAEVTPDRAVIASVDAVGFAGELDEITDRLSTSGPRYHYRGPG
jgi:hypothetical protein